MLRNLQQNCDRGRNTHRVSKIDEVQKNAEVFFVNKKIMAQKESDLEFKCMQANVFQFNPSPYLYKRVDWAETGGRKQVLP